MDRRIRIGIFGCGRGRAYGEHLGELGAELVACCDAQPRKLEEAKQSGLFTQDAGFYTDFDEFIRHDMDAVILANYWHQHAPYAIRAMEAGKDVLSECTPAATLADCVALVRCAERTGRRYMLGENYTHFRSVEQMRRIYQGGSMGGVAYAEGEYVHPARQVSGNTLLRPDPYHWRNWLPCTSYITHALAPLLYITGERPVSVNAKGIFRPEFFEASCRRSPDIAGILLVETDSGALFRVTGHAMFAGTGSRYRICGTKGCAETLSGKGAAALRLCYNPWDLPTPQTPAVSEFEAAWDHPELAELAEKAGHGGGDLFVMYEFLRYLRGETEPAFSVIPAVTLSAVEIMAGRSVQSGGNTFAIPDFTREEDRVRYENDRLCPIPDENHEVSYPCCSHPDYVPAQEALRAAEVPYMT